MPSPSNRLSIRISLAVRSDLRALAHGKGVRLADLIAGWLRDFTEDQTLPSSAAIDTRAEVQITPWLPSNLLALARKRAAQMGISLTHVIRAYAAAAVAAANAVGEGLTTEQKALREIGVDPHDPLLLAALVRLGRARPGQVIMKAVKLWLTQNPPSARHLPHRFRQTLLQRISSKRDEDLADLAEVLLRADPSLPYGALALLLATAKPGSRCSGRVREMQRQGDKTLTDVAKRLVQAAGTLWSAQRDLILAKWVKDQFILVTKDRRRKP
jgi:hypothetical protein